MKPSIGVREKDQQVEIYDMGTHIEVVFSELDLEDEPSIIGMLKFIKVNDLKISLDDEETVQNKCELLYSFLKAICEKKYPPQAVKATIAKYCEVYPLMKQAFKKYCKENTCVCSVAVSAGCVNINKLADSIASAISPFYSYATVQMLLQKLKGKEKEEEDAEIRHRDE